MQLSPFARSCFTGCSRDSLDPMAVGSDPVPTLQGSLGATLQVEGAQSGAPSSHVVTSFEGPVLLEPEEAQPGRIIAGRYRLVERLGVGAHGEVWTADDRVLREPVALKWMGYATGRFQARIRQEITTLRMLRMPGVVRLLDDGVEDGRPFLVMERVEGRPFPGGPELRDGVRVRWTWAELADTTVALLEVLARMHAAGVIHRDLKPDNILVSPEGRPTVLDFGISLWRDSLWRDATGRLTDAGQILGTPLFLAPEQILDASVDARTDLYAVGVMLYQAVTGVGPHEATTMLRLLQARISNPAPPVRERAPDLPAAVAAGIDRLLELRMEQRFQSASEVLAALRGEPSTERCATVLPRLGRGDALAAVLAAVAAGRSIDVVGPPGSGRTRCLEDAATALANQGRSIVRTSPARAPLASLRSIVEVPEDDAQLRLTESTALVETALQSTLTAGVIVLADDADQLDPWSAAIMNRCRGGAGVIVRALPAAPPGALTGEVALLEPLDEPALRPLFAGPDRLFHLREDAARSLWERTEGLPARIEAEVMLWTRLGLARWEGERLGLDRDTLGRLSAGLPSAMPEQPAPGGPKEEPDLEAHRTVAKEMRPGQDRRLFHLLAAEDVRAATIEAVELARQHAVEGDLGRAVAVLAEGLHMARRQDARAASSEEIRVLEVWVDVAFAEATPRALDRVLYELSRVGRRGPEVDRLEALVRAGIAAPGSSRERALELATEIPPFNAPELERRRVRVRVTVAAARSSWVELEQVLTEVAAWATRSGEPLAQLSLAEGEALLRYGQGRFEEAAALHAEAALREPWLTGRIAATLKCASTLLEAFHHREAAERAAEGRELAARCRHAHLEGRAEWLLRAARYRMGETTAPDMELVEAVARLGVHELEALVDLNEAAVAFRAGLSAIAVELSGNAGRLWREMDRPWAELLARSLSLACGAAAQEGEVAALAERAMVCPVPGIGAQALGLLGRSFPEMRGSWRDAVGRLVSEIPRERWYQRIDVLSVEEALEGALGAEGGQEMMESDDPLETAKTPEERLGDVAP